MIPMVRQATREVFNQTRFDNPGLLFTRGLISMNDSQDIGPFLEKMASVQAPGLYQRAFNRWQQHTVTDENCVPWCGQIDGRLYLGVGEPHVLETNLTLNHSYGVPVIPGSSLKGLARAYASHALNPEAIDVLFGKGSDEQQGDAGYLIFHDAWWIPGSSPSPFALEIITVHHPDYYKQKGSKRASAMDSPTPNHQLAIQGSFYFVIEGSREWAELGMKILKNALMDQGLGAKSTSGYGYFSEDERHQQQLEEAKKEAARALLSPAERLQLEVEELSAQKIAEMFSKNYNKTKERADFALFMQAVKKHHAALIKSWENEDKKSNKYKAFKKLNN